MTKKTLKDYRRDPNATTDDIVNAIETTPAELTPDPEVAVASGDETAPVAGAKHRDSLNSLYDKARGSREHTQHQDAEVDSSVERTQALVAEAAGGEVNPEGIDTNLPDRFAADRGEETEEHYTARMIQEQYDRDNEPEKGKHEEKDVNKASDALPEIQNDAMVEVTILGRTLEVPQQDIDDAGGQTAYQKSRSATIKLQRAATLEAKALKTLDEIEHGEIGAQPISPSTDGPSEADIDSLHEEMMDTVANGTVEDMREWVANKLTPQPIAEPVAASTIKPETETPVVTSEIQEELDSQFEDDRVDANTMMQTEFVDIMADSELLGLAQQRFNVIKTNPLNEGRSQKEMAREAANFVRTLGRRLDGDYRPNKPDPIEAERKERIERKRALPQQTRADTPAPSHVKKEDTVPSRKEHLARLRRRAGHDLAG